MLWAAGSYRHFRRLTPSTLLDATEASAPPPTSRWVSWA